MMKSSLLAASALALAHADSQNWFAMKLAEGDRARIQRVMAEVDFRGAYKNDLGLFVGSDVLALADKLAVPADRLVALSEYSEDKPLWVGEYEPRFDVIQAATVWEQNVREQAAKTDLEFVDLHSLGLNHGSLLVLADSNPEEREWDQTAWVPVAPRALKPEPAMLESSLAKAMLNSRYKVSAEGNKLTFAEPDPTVQRMVDAINVDRMRSDLSELEAIFTRLASSKGNSSVETAEEWLLQKYRDLGVRTNLYGFDSRYSNNVNAEIISDVNPDTWVLVGAHYDSRSTSTTNVDLRAPGADDNGSGTVALLEMVRVIQELGLKFEYSIRFMHFSAEEQGLIGSRAYAKDLAEQGEDVLCMMNGDMLGYRLPGQPITLGMKDRSVTQWLLDTVNQLSETYVDGLQVGLSSSCCSDYLAFFENGFAAVGYFENTGGASDYPHYHRSTDLMQYLDFEQQKMHTMAWMAGVGTFAVPLE